MRFALLLIFQGHALFVPTPYPSRADCDAASGALISAYPTLFNNLYAVCVPVAPAGVEPARP